ncbi:hypothetical protein K439DRAFT_1633200 [Ramaria rubella]|nr:hypothetical protein K439DRAFT_1633200 [Ramaria rubella]
MIRSLSKPLLSEWTSHSLTRKNQNSSSRHIACGHAQSFTLSCRRTSILFIHAQGYHSHPYALLHRHRPHYVNAPTTRPYSTLPPPPKPKPAPHTVPPSTTTTVPRKPKVDLRPAPKTLPTDNANARPPRPPVSQSTSTARPSATPTSASTSTTAATNPPTTSTHFTPPSTSPSSPNLNPTPTPDPTPSPLKAAQQDLLDATRHGILAPPPAGASLPGRLWHNFKQLFKFYWNGLRLVFVDHRREAAAIRARVRGDVGGEMTRWETRFLRTYRWDVAKLFPFILTLLILEEAIPFIVLYLPGLLPSTCLLPSQRARIDAKRRAKQILHAERARTVLAASNPDPGYDGARGVEGLTPELTSSVSGILARATWGPLLLHRRRIKSYLTHLASDDALLVREDMGARLRSEELVEALEERGFILPSPSPPPAHMLQQLQWWLRDARDDGTRIGLVLRTAREYEYSGGSASGPAK